MLNSKIFIGGIAGGVLFFLLGYLVYGVLLSDFMAANYNACMGRPMGEFRWWAMILSNFVYGFFLAIVIQWSGADDFLSGLKTGAVVGFMTGLSIGLSYYAMTTLYYSRIASIADVLITTVFTAVVSGLIAMAMSKVPDRA